MLKFDLKEGQVIRKIKHIGYAQQITDNNRPEIEKRMTWSALKLLNHLGLLPRGYFTRVVNGNISYETARKEQGTRYFIKLIMKSMQRYTTEKCTLH